MATILRNASETTLYDESCPLLCNPDNPEALKHFQLHPTPLPKGQLAALCSVRLVDPIAFTQVIFPYINEFITLLNVTNDPSQIGFYSGLVESCFAMAQLCSIYHWAKISDTIGRRPVIMAGTLGIAITTLLLGLSSSLLQILVSRCLAGFFSGNVAVIHSVLGELTDSTNQAIAFPIYGLFWPLGSIIGPLIGGALSNPAIKYPKYYNNSFLRTYPYFLPCFIAAIFAFFGVFLACISLEETLPSKRHQTASLSKCYGTTGSEGDVLAVSSPPSISELLSIPVIRALSTSGCALCFIATAFDVVFVLFCYSPIEAGGLAFSASQIGYSLAVAGTISASIQLLFLPTLLRTFDIAKMYNFCMLLWPLSFAFLPVLNHIARTGFNEGAGTLDSRIMFVLWTGIAFVLACSRVGCLAYSISMILVKENAPGPASLGSTNGLVQFSMCLARAFSPAFVSSAFAYSTQTNILGGHLWVLVMVCICFWGCYLSREISYSNSRVGK
ncbi:major facilitator superfamily domain-containing protein [Collybia nuda]|uniref:Major facilitator superfamily domain-containing protein n=1 Tax=Collybia nuda TaxID=64659 RepID=A0A9P5XZT2_9AGAR|nr:major facilitator superfamily domain-containing protein [Collybia nuda]